jgi:hypothetical protein
MAEKPAEKPWEERVRAFLKRTGEELKRAGGEIRNEAELLMKEVQDPDVQRKVKTGLKEFGGWARKTAEEVAEVVEQGVHRAEAAFKKQAATGAGSPGEPSPTPPSPPPTGMDEAPPAPPKTVGGARGAARAAQAKMKRTVSAAGKAVKKTIGPKPKGTKKRT